MAPLATARQCMREPIPEILDAARLLDAAVTAHLVGRSDLAEELIRVADMPVLRDYTESLWGAKSPYVQYRLNSNSPPSLPIDRRIKVRMPNFNEEALLYNRDGFHCRFCGTPVIRGKVRERIRKAYPAALRWGKRTKNSMGLSSCCRARLTTFHLTPEAALMTLRIRSWFASPVTVRGCITLWTRSG